MPSRKLRFTILVLGVMVCLIPPPATSEAGPLLDWLQRRRAERRAKKNPAVPIAAYPAVTTVNYPVAPATGSTCGAGFCQATVVQYVPETSYRTVWESVPVTTWRTTTQQNPATGLPITCTQPCTSYTWQARRVPYTTYRPVYGTVPVTPGAAPTAAVYPTSITPSSAAGPGYTPGDALVQGYASAGPGVACNGCSPATAPAYQPAPSYSAAPSYQAAPSYSTGPSHQAAPSFPAVPSYPATPAYPSYPAPGGSTLTPVPSYGAPPTGTQVPADTPPSLRPGEASMYPPPVPLPPTLNGQPNEHGASTNHSNSTSSFGLPATPSHRSGVYGAPTSEAPAAGGNGVRPVPDLDRQRQMDADGVPRLLNPRDQTAARPIQLAWASTPIAWPQQAYQPPRDAEPRLLRVDEAWDDSGWRSARN